MNKYIFFLNDFGFKTKRDDVSLICVEKNGIEYHVKEEELLSKFDYSSLQEKMISSLDSFEIESDVNIDVVELQKDLDAKKDV